MGKGKRMSTGGDVLLAGIFAGVGWVGYLARNYFTELAAIKLEEARNNQENEQRRIEKQEKYFEMLLQNILGVVGEEKDRLLSVQEQVIQTHIKLLESNEQIIRHLENLTSGATELKQEIKACLLPTNIWSGEERRSRLE